MTASYSRCGAGERCRSERSTCNDSRGSLRPGLMRRPAVYPSHTCAAVPASFRPTEDGTKGKPGGSTFHAKHRIRSRRVHRTREPGTLGACGRSALEPCASAKSITAGRAQGDCRNRMRRSRSTDTLMSTASTPPVVESEASTRPAPLHVSRETPLRPWWVRPSPSRGSRSADRSRASDNLRSFSRDHGDDGRLRTECSLRRITPPPSTSRRFHVNPYLQPAPRVVEAIAVGIADPDSHMIHGPTIAEASRV